MMIVDFHKNRDTFFETLTMTVTDRVGENLSKSSHDTEFFVLVTSRLVSKVGENPFRDLDAFKPALETQHGPHDPLRR